jgi:Golgi SNAP receptor complex protein 2
MDKLYIETKGGLMQINEMLVKFESCSQPEEAQFAKANITERLNQLDRSCDQLDIYVTKEPANRRYDSKLKVDQLKYDLKHYKAAFNSMQYKK